MNYQAYFKLSYGIYIISSFNDGNLGGYIGNTAFQVTAEPAKIAVSCNKDNFTASMIEKSGYFSLSVLNQEASSELIGLFGYQSGKNVNKFENIKYTKGSSGCPIVLEDSSAWFECRITEKFDVGTHIIYVGEVIAYDMINSEASPMTYSYYRDIKKGMAPKNAPTYIDKTKIDIEKTELTSETDSYSKGKSYKCLLCGYIHEADAEEGAFEDLPDDWTCPICGADKSMFEEV